MTTPGIDRIGLCVGRLRGLEFARRRARVGRLPAREGRRAPSAARTPRASGVGRVATFADAALAPAFADAAFALLRRFALAPLAVAAFAVVRFAADLAGTFLRPVRFAADFLLPVLAATFFLRPAVLVFFTCLKSFLLFTARVARTRVRARSRARASGRGGRIGGARGCRRRRRIAWRRA